MKKLNSEEAMSFKRTGEVITFYSYKGGTGRSMLLANVAWVLASSGARVLVVDWDLEAPGLHRYFRPFLGDDPELRGQAGVIDWLSDYWTARVSESGLDVEQIVQEFADPRKYVRRMDTGTYLPEGGGIDILGPGKQNLDYGAAVSDFDFAMFYEKLDGEEFIGVAKRVLVGPHGYDYVLVDSRTGVSDTSGICTISLADTVVVCFTYNNQSVLGASRVALDIRSRRQDAGSKLSSDQVRDSHFVYPFRLFAVPTRVEDTQIEKLQERQKVAWKAFDGVLTNVDASETEAYWLSVQIPTHPSFAYEEVLAACVYQAEDKRSLLGAVLELVSRLTDGGVRSVFKLTAPERSDLRRMFAGVPGSETSKSSWSAFQRFGHRVPDNAQQSRILMETLPLLAQLCTVVDGGADGRRLTLVPIDVLFSQLTAEEIDVADRLVALGLAKFRLSQDRRRALALADSAVLTSWTELNRSIVEKASLLKARDQLAQARRTWEQSGKTFSALGELAKTTRALAITENDYVFLGQVNLRWWLLAKAVADREAELARQIGTFSVLDADFRQYRSQRKWKSRLLSAVAGMACLALAYFWGMEAPLRYQTDKLLDSWMALDGAKGVRSFDDRRAGLMALFEDVFPSLNMGLSGDEKGTGHRRPGWLQILSFIPWHEESHDRFDRFSAMVEGKVFGEVSYLLMNYPWQYEIGAQDYANAVEAKRYVVNCMQPSDKRASKASGGERDIVFLPVSGSEKKRRLSGIVVSRPNDRRALDKASGSLSFNAYELDSIDVMGKTCVKGEQVRGLHFQGDGLSDLAVAFDADLRYLFVFGKKAPVSGSGGAEGEQTKLWLFELRLTADQTKKDKFYLSADGPIPLPPVAFSRWKTGGSKWGSERGEFAFPLRTMPAFGGVVLSTDRGSGEGWFVARNLTELQTVSATRGGAPFSDLKELPRVNESAIAGSVQQPDREAEISEGHPCQLVRGGDERPPPGPWSSKPTAKTFSLGDGYCATLFRYSAAESLENEGEREVQPGNGEDKYVRPFDVAYLSVYRPVRAGDVWNKVAITNIGVPELERQSVVSVGKIVGGQYEGWLGLKIASNGTISHLYAAPWRPYMLAQLVRTIRNRGSGLRIGEQ